MKNNEIKTIQDLLTYSKKKLLRANIESYSLDADLIVVHACDLHNRERLLLSLTNSIGGDVVAKCKELVLQRAGGKPVAHILNKVDFWDHKLHITKDVLIPRPDSETLIEVLIKIVNQKDLVNQHLQILDLGTGSGCLIVTALKLLNNANGTAIDIDDNALEIAAINARSLGVSDRISFIKSNWFEALKNGEKYDIIISNPPYISIKEWKDLAGNVKEHEPKVALTDFSDGLSHYKTIAKDIPKFLNKQGIVLLEIGYNQMTSVLKIFQEKGFFVNFYKDLSGIDRVAVLGYQLKNKVD